MPLIHLTIEIDTDELEPDEVDLDHKMGLSEKGHLMVTDGCKAFAGEIIEGPTLQ